MDTTTYRDGSGRLVLAITLDPEQEDQLGHDSERELAFALELTDPDDPSALRWLAATALQRVISLTSNEENR